jgi:methionine synthase II (cobalamin-independent)
VRPIDIPVGLATSIGSLPHDDPRDAVEFVLEHHPRLPVAPSLPNASGYEQMIAQAAWGIEGVSVLPDGSLRVDDPDAVEPGAPLADPGIGGPPFAAMRAFLGAVTGRSGPIKLQLTGPVTLGLALHAVGVPADRAFAVAGAAVRVRARALVAAATGAAPLAAPIVVVDEPGLAAAMHPGFPLPPDGALDLVSSALAALEPHAVTGVHCCGSADWHAVLQSGPQVLSLPLDAGAVAHAGAIAAHLERGGWIAWGAVPTDRPIGTSADRIWRRLSDEWCALVQRGCDPVRLREQALVTPACGLAGHGVAQAAAVLALARQVARRLETQMSGLRLTVGA